MTGALPRLVLVLAAAASFALPCAAQDATERPPEFSVLGDDPAFNAKKASRFLAGKRFEPSGVHVDSLGRIVVVGHRLSKNHHAPGVARLRPDGRPDRRFGARGISVLRVDGSVLASAVDSGDRIVLAGNFVDRQGDAYLAARVRAKGGLDTGFSEDGLFEAAGQFGDSWERVQIDPVDDGVVAISDTQVPTRSFYVVRVTPGGARDPDFGAGGAAVRIDGDCRGFAVDARGGAIVAGDTGVRRFDADGREDRSFGSAGFLRLADGQAVVAQDVAVDGEGHILVSVPVAGIHRFLPGGSRDVSFSGDGFAPWPGTLPAPTRPEGGLLFLAVAPDDSERYAVAAQAAYVNDGNVFAQGFFVEAIAGPEPDRVGLFVTHREPSSGSEVTRILSGLALPPGGASAVVAGHDNVPGGRSVPFVERVDLAPRGRDVRTDIGIAFAVPVVVENVLSALVFDVSVDFTNRSDAAWPGGEVAYFLSADGVFDASDTLLFRATASAVPAGAVLREEARGVAQASDLPGGGSGMRIIAVLDYATSGFDADASDDVAVSAALE